MKITSVVEMDLPVRELANAIAGEDSSLQAKFFEEMAIAPQSWPKQIVGDYTWQYTAEQQWMALGQALTRKPNGLEMLRRILHHADEEIGGEDAKS